MCEVISVFCIVANGHIFVTLAWQVAESAGCLELAENNDMMMIMVITSTQLLTTREVYNLGPVCQSVCLSVVYTRITHSRQCCNLIYLQPLRHNRPEKL